MRVLTPKVWSKFEITRDDGTTVFDRKKFENLIRDLLRLGFDGHWEGQAIVWDEGMDYVDRSIPSDAIWAECKMYRKPLEANKIQNSLVMALNERNVRSILFFSYSPLDEEAIVNLSRFSATTNKIVLVFDDEKLENLIFKEWDDLKHYFPEAPEYAIPKQLEGVELYSSFSNNISVSGIQNQHLRKGYKHLNRQSVSINTPCLYEIFFRSNEIYAKHTVSLDFSAFAEEKSIGMRILNKDYFFPSGNMLHRRDLLPGQTDSIRLFLAPTKPGIQSIPPIVILVDGKPRQLSSVEIQVDRLHRPSLVGSSVYNSLSLFQATISSTNNICSHTVAGVGGVGKSRYLEEATMRLLGANFSVFSFDGRSQNCRDIYAFAANLICQIWKLPNQYRLESDPQLLFQMSSDGLSKTRFDRIFQILGKVGIRDLSSSDLEELFKLLISGIVKQRAALIIDNVQKLDETSLELLEKICTRLTGTIGQNVFVLAFNLDELVYSKEAAIFHRNLMRSALSQENEQELYIELKEFDSNSIEMFLNTICQSMDSKLTFTEHYPQLTRLIIQHVLPRPLDLYQLFLAAHDGDGRIATLKDGFFYIRDLDAFYLLIRTVNRQTENILRSRLVYLRQREGCIQVVMTLAYLGDVDLNQLISVSGGLRKTVQFLLEGGWIRTAAGNRIDFFHPSVERFFIDMILIAETAPASELGPIEDVKAILAGAIEENKLKNFFPLAHFALSPKPDKEDTGTAFEKIAHLEKGPPTIRKKLLMNAVCDFIIQSRDLSHSLWLPHAQTIAKFAAEDDKEELIARLLTFRSILSAFRPVSETEAYDFFNLMRQYASLSSVLGRHKEGDEKLKEELQLLDNIDWEISESARSRVRANLLNRRCVFLQKMGFKVEALELGQQAFQVAEENGHKEYASLALFDIATIYKTDLAEKDDFIRTIKAAILFFDQHREEINQKEPSIELVFLENRAKLHGLLGEYDLAISDTEEVIQKSRQQNIIYYVIRGLMIRATFLLIESQQELEPDLSQLDYISRLIYEIEDLAITTRMHKFYKVALHLMGIIRASQNEVSMAQSSFEAALTKIKDGERKSENNSFVSPEDRSVLLDGINFWIQHCPDTPFPIDRAFFDRNGLFREYRSLSSGKEVSPQMLFASGSFNYPVV